MEFDLWGQVLPGVIEQMYPGQSFTVGEDLGWAFYGDDVASSTVTVVSLSDEDKDGLLRITAGVACRVPEAAKGPLFDALTDVNGRLFFGRAFVVPAPDDCYTILLQEIIPLWLLSVDFAPSTKYLGMLLQNVSREAALATDRIVPSCGGEPFTDAMAIYFCG